MARTECLPLVVDLDGTLTPSDTLIESILNLVRQSPLNLLRLIAWVPKGRAAFKEAVAGHSSIGVERLPYRPAVLSFLRDEKRRGRRIILATGAHRSIADSVAAHLGVIDEVLATTADRNLVGEAKLKAIRERVGDEFVYAGNSRADLSVWAGARAAVLVAVAPGTARKARQAVPIEREFLPERAGISAWLNTFRVHHWLKNLLLFVPLLTSFSFMEPGKLATVVVAFFAFSLATSAIYAINDLWDLESDRGHGRKRLRPFADGRIPIVRGLAAAGGAAALGAAVALLVSPGFFRMAILYMAVAVAYIGVLKRCFLIDVLTLALLYVLRILAGAAAIDVTVSVWLLAFSLCLFPSLALVKRCAELVSLRSVGRSDACGRGYRVSDLTMLWPLGWGTAVSAVIVFGFFIGAPETRQRYATPDLLWLVAVGLAYWLARLWTKTARGEMHDDPLIHAIHDRGGRIVLAAMVAIVLVAHFLSLEAVS